MGRVPVATRVKTRSAAGRERLAGAAETASPRATIARMIRGGAGGRQRGGRPRQSFPRATVGILFGGRRYVANLIGATVLIPRLGGGGLRNLGHFGMASGAGCRLRPGQNV